MWTLYFFTRVALLHIFLIDTVWLSKMTIAKMTCTWPLWSLELDISHGQVLKDVGVSSPSHGNKTWINCSFLCITYRDGTESKCVPIYQGCIDCKGCRANSTSNHITWDIIILQWCCNPVAIGIIPPACTKSIGQFRVHVQPQVEDSNLWLQFHFFHVLPASYIDP